MVGAPRKTRAQINKVKLERCQARRVPRQTKGRWTFQKAKLEAEYRGFKLAVSAESHWNSQADVIPSWRKLLMADGRKPWITNIINGHNRSSPPTANEIAVANTNRSSTQKDRALGQRNCVESFSIEAVKRMLDPRDEYDFEVLLDGLNVDVGIRLKGTELFAGAQFKASEFGDVSNNYHISQSDGLSGQRYETLIIIASAIRNLYTSGFRESMTQFNHIPSVEIGELFLFGNASEMPNATFNPYPRRTADDQYGDSRFVVDLDTQERLESMRHNFRSLVHKKAMWTRQQLWFSVGSGTPNPCVSPNHVEEILNCEALSRVVGFDNLMAPKTQNETVDVIWCVNTTLHLKISLKTVSVDTRSQKNGFDFKLGMHPNSHFCDFVFAMYKNKSGVRTHVSVIDARRVYKEDEIRFYWSDTSNEDVLYQRVDLTDPEAKDLILSMIEGIRRSR